MIYKESKSGYLFSSSKSSNYTDQPKKHNITFHFQGKIAQYLLEKVKTITLAQAG